MDVPWWIVEILQPLEGESTQIPQSAHLSRQGQDVWILTDVQGVQGGEGADAQGNLPELVVAEVQGADGRRESIYRHRGELVVREVEDLQTKGPFWDVWDLHELVVGKVELLETGQLQNTARDRGELIVLQVQLQQLEGKTEPGISTSVYYPGNYVLSTRNQSTYTTYTLLVSEDVAEELGTLKTTGLVETPR